MSTSGIRRKPGRPKDPARRAELLSVARRLFAERGFGAASLGVIATEAGVSKPTLLHHFSSKEELYLEAVAGALTGLGDLVVAARLDEGGFGERLDRLGRLVVDYLVSHPEAARLLLRELVDHGPFLDGPGGNTVQQTLVAVSAFLAAGMAAGEFVEQDPGQLTLTIVGLHLYYFASDDISAEFLGADLFAPDMARRRRVAILEQIRRLCGVEGSWDPR